MKQKLRLHSLYFPQNTLMLTESRREFRDLHSIFRPRALRYLKTKITQNIVNELLCKCPRENQTEPGRWWYSSNLRCRSNLAQMLGSVRKWLGQKSRSKYFIPFKSGGPPAKMAKYTPININQCLSEISDWAVSSPTWFSHGHTLKALPLRLPSPPDQS